MDNKKEKGVGIPTGKIDIEFLVFKETGCTSIYVGWYETYEEAEESIKRIAANGEEFTSGHYEIKKRFVLEPIE